MIRTPTATIITTGTVPDPPAIMITIPGTGMTTGISSIRNLRIR